MTTQQIALVKNSWSEVLMLQQNLGIYFYNKLFSIDPSLEALFKINIGDRERKFTYMITYIAFKLDQFDELLKDAIDLGKRHQQYRVPAGSYQTVEKALLTTLKDNLNSHWTEETEDAWKAAYDKLTRAMLTGEKK